MFFKVLLCTTLATLTYAAPQDHHATSYVSTNLAGHGNIAGDDGGLGSRYVHYAPITYTKHVPIVVKHGENHEEKYEEEDHAHPKYIFHYAVEDKHTGDIKSQKESRDGDVVQGEYSLKEADGTTRIVKYTADKKSGFNAVVIRKGHAAHPQVEEKKVIKKVLVPVSQHHDDYHGLYTHY